jgi:hypothetical protein
MNQPGVAPTDAPLSFYRSELLENVVPFWMRYAVDREYGGFMTCLNRDGTVVDTDKGVWQQGRASWLFSKLYNCVEPHEEWLELARLGVEFLDRYCFDPTGGRMWFHVTREGRPIHKRRCAFSESFASIAYGQFAMASGSDEYADKARRTFQGSNERSRASSVDKRHVPHGHRLSFGIHEDPVPVVQHNRLVIGMANLAAHQDLRVAPLNDPGQVTQIRLAADEALVLPRREAVRVLGADIDRFTSVANQFFDDMRLAGTAPERLVSQNPGRVRAKANADRNKKPLTLANECLIAAAVSFSRLHRKIGLSLPNVGRLERLHRRRNGRDRGSFWHGRDEPMTLVVPAEELMLAFSIARHEH